MKKIIALALLGISTASLPALSQEAQQAHRTVGQNDVTQLADDELAQEEKVEISTSELPSEVTQHFEQSEYSDMSIITVYKVSAAGDDDSGVGADGTTYTEDEEAEPSTENMTNETATTEEIEETGEVVSAEAPEAEAGDGIITEEEKALYERNDYDKYSEANSDAYAEIAKEKQQSDDAEVKYELRVEGNEQQATLIYDNSGQLLNVEKADM